jgi:hypothetical protein
MALGPQLGPRQRRAKATRAKAKAGQGGRPSGRLRRGWPLTWRAAAGRQWAPLAAARLGPARHGPAQACRNEWGIGAKRARRRGAGVRPLLAMLCKASSPRRGVEPHVCPRVPHCAVHPMLPPHVCPRVPTRAGPMRTGCGAARSRGCLGLPGRARRACGSRVTRRVATGQHPLAGRAPAGLPEPDPRACLIHGPGAGPLTTTAAQAAAPCQPCPQRAQASASPHRAACAGAAPPPPLPSGPPRAHLGRAQPQGHAHAAGRPVDHDPRGRGRHARGEVRVPHHLPRHAPLAPHVPHGAPPSRQPWPGRAAAAHAQRLLCPLPPHPPSRGPGHRVRPNAEQCHVAVAVAVAGPLDATGCHRVPRKCRWVPPGAARVPAERSSGPAPPPPRHQGDLAWCCTACAGS